MFRSKWFTIAFCILSVLIIGLAGLFCYLVFGSGGERLTEAVSGSFPYEDTQDFSFDESSLTTPAADDIPETESTLSADTSDDGDSSASETVASDTESKTETAVSTESAAQTTASAGSTVRPLRTDEPHNVPVVGEDIKANGVVRIVKSGDSGEGIVFHVQPRFDAANSPGNLTNFSGAFDVWNKIYIIDNGKPFLLYKTDDDYYVTSNPAYVSFEDYEPTVPADPKRVGDFGRSESTEIVVRVYQDDGTTLAFSMFNFSPASDELMPVLENVIARYNESGSADFEYVTDDGNVHTGRISFETVSGAEYSRKISVVFETPVSFRSGAQTEVVLHN